MTTKNKRAVGTVVTRNYFAYALALGKSVLEHNPEITFYVLVIDDRDRKIHCSDRRIQILHADQIMDRQKLLDQAFYYNAFELSNALKADLHSYLWNHTDHETWIYLDGDTFVLDSLDPIFSELEQKSILLSRHITRPLQPDEDSKSEPIENRFLRFGIYNGGFFGVRRSQNAKMALDWWSNQLRMHCREGVSGEYVDQLAINLIPTLFDGVKWIEHRGANVAYWNYHEAQFTENPVGKFHFAGVPIVFFHFSGWSYSDPTRLSKHRPELRNKEAFAPLGTLYHRALKEAGHEEFSKLSYGFAHFENGTPIQSTTRALYWTKINSGSGAGGNPFQHPELQPVPPKASLVRRLVRSLRAI